MRFFNRKCILGLVSFGKSFSTQFIREYKEIYSQNSILYTLFSNVIIRTFSIKFNSDCSTS